MFFKLFWYFVLLACYPASYAIGFFRRCQEGCQVCKRYDKQFVHELHGCTVLVFLTAAASSIGSDFIWLFYHLPFKAKNTIVLTAVTFLFILVLTAVYWVTSLRLVRRGSQDGAEHYKRLCACKRAFCRAKNHTTVVQNCPMAEEFRCPCGIERRVVWRVHPRDLERALLKAKHAQERQALEEAYGAPHRDLRMQEISVPLYPHVVPATRAMNPWHPDILDDQWMTVEVATVEVQHLVTNPRPLLLPAATDEVYVDPDKVVAFNPPEVVPAQLPSTVEGRGKIIGLMRRGNRTLQTRQTRQGLEIETATQRSDGTVRRTRKFVSGGDSVVALERALRDMDAQEG